MNESAAARAGAREKEQASYTARRGGRTETEGGRGGGRGREREREKRDERRRGNRRVIG